MTTDHPQRTPAHERHARMRRTGQADRALWAC